MLRNDTKGKVWTGEVCIADTFLKRFLGLMFRRVTYALILVLPTETRTNASIHGFFMREPIDVIFLDSERRVVDMTLLKPWHVYLPKRPARYVVEGPVGLISALNAEEGDVITW
ncbi:DUF192 domain-containing protein [Pyrococcus yayanosii]|uniref:UPF0127 protein PYCH_05310 n=1 Tax=Pyrococcus yayanosii (strain CH1 / JCM 16557) TaxID=529709 RepID=F8AHT8_PYRYC|nr:DUF192 domain-containing protein [Pyrococcus yayanosii]AEH24221.1 hypothetical protein PYCH_05310 [Pyrococcus yayanosii CH1]